MSKKHHQMPEQEVSAHEEVNVECLAEHNRLRAMHGSPALILDPKLMQMAQAYAEELTTSQQKEQSNDYGENIAVRTSTGLAKLNGKQATLMWYSEIENYDFAKENQLNCGESFSLNFWILKRCLSPTVPRVCGIETHTNGCHLDGNFISKHYPIVTAPMIYLT
ncbi:unnamed protein product [Dicrocoelium dendriticum]|nr:unnamed protein product [Dicrocoelium dendriticum]